MAKYILSKKALEDLNNIWNYTCEVWSEEQAESYYLLLTDCCQNLANNKLNGRKYLEVSEDLYGILIGQHIIFYQKSNKGHLQVIRILHSQMDLKIRIQE